MLPYLATAAAATLAVAIALGLLIRRLAQPARCELINADWLTRFSVAKYRPMERLLSAEDYRYLERQKGFHEGMAQRLRRERIRVFRGYLRLLKSDYRKLESTIALYLANSPVDRPDMARALFKRRLRFTVAVAAAEWRLRLHALGLKPSDVRRLVLQVDEMRSHLRRQALARQAAA